MMNTRTKIELSALAIFFFGMLSWGFSCEPGRCVEALGQWLMIWWLGAGVAALYWIWTRMK